MNTELNGQMPENSLVDRMAAGAFSRATREYPRRMKNASAVVVNR
jgi:hypothetical protein